MAEIVTQQFRTNPTNPPPPFRVVFQKQVTEGGAFQTLTKYSGKHSEYHDWSFSARRVLTQSGREICWTTGSGYRDRSMKSTRTMCSSTEERRIAVPQTWTGSTRNCTRRWPSRHLTRRWHPSSHWKKWKSRESLRGNAWNVKREDTIDIEWRSHSDLPQAFYRWESTLKEFQRGRPAELDGDVKANAMRHMMPKEIVDAADLQPQYRTFSEIREYMLQQARQRADVYVGDVCHPTKKIGTVTPRVSTNMPTPASVPMGVSQMSLNVSKTEAVEQENDTYQYEQDQECDGDELFAGKGKGKGGL